jgi:hypothetical protein
LVSIIPVIAANSFAGICTFIVTSPSGNMIVLTLPFTGVTQRSANAEPADTIPAQSANTKRVCFTIFYPPEKVPHLAGPPGLETILGTLNPMPFRHEVDTLTKI